MKYVISAPFMTPNELNNEFPEHVPCPLRWLTLGLIINCNKGEVCNFFAC